MRLVRWGEVGREKPGLIDDNGIVRNLESEIDDIAGASLSPESLNRLGSIDPACLKAVPNDTRLGPCVGGIGKIVCVGLNYTKSLRL